MRLIPDVIIRECSPAERKVFSVLERIDLGDSWVALHSLNCSEHAYKHWAEIDFLLVGGEGLFVLEVKGGRIRRHGGIWMYTDRFGVAHKSSEGPFDQARSAMYALEKMLLEKYGLRRVIGRPLFGFGVVFPDQHWDLDTVETPATLVADHMTVSDPSQFKRYLHHLVKEWKRRRKRRTFLDARARSVILERLRPDIDLYPPLGVQLGAAVERLEQLTREQYLVMDAMEQNERLLVYGGAGTGKTFLAVQSARREIARGRTTLVVVHNPVLATYIRQMLSDTDVAVTHFNALQRSRAIDSIETLIVDEGQDLMTMDHLEVLDCVLNGGLDGGRWRWFMDPNNQAGLAGQYSDDAHEYLRSTSGAPAICRLRRNCRNTKEIATHVSLWTGADLGRTEVTGFGRPPTVVSVEDEHAAAKAVGSILASLVEQDVGYGEIALVGWNAEMRRVLDAIPRHLRRHTCPLGSATSNPRRANCITYGDVVDFKGMERPVVIMIGPWAAEGEDILRRLYVATTRANWGLWMIVGASVKNFLAEQVRQNFPALTSRMESEE